MHLLAVSDMVREPRRFLERVFCFFAKHLELCMNLEWSGMWHTRFFTTNTLDSLIKIYRFMHVLYARTILMDQRFVGRN